MPGIGKTSSLFQRHQIHMGNTKDNQWRRDVSGMAKTHSTLSNTFGWATKAVDTGTTGSSTSLCLRIDEAKTIRKKEGWRDVAGTQVCTTSLEELYGSIRASLGRHEQIWTTLSSCCKLTKFYLSISRDRLRKLIRFLTGHYQFNKHRHTIRVVTDPIQEIHTRGHLA